MKNLFSRLEIVLNASNLTDLKAEFANIYEDFKSSKLNLENNLCALDSKTLKSCYILESKLVSPLKIRRPKKLNSTISMAKILHSIAHIEASAIILALDASYRFRGLAREFYADWLEVAREEIKHFSLIEALLKELGYSYGDFAVHDNLFQAMHITQDSMNLRMGLVHRGLEAKGLDANPFVRQKLLHVNTPNSIKNDIEHALDVILHDEITHVSKGDKWWKFSAQKDNEDVLCPSINSFLALCKKFNYFRVSGKILNEEARVKAGFSIQELQGLKHLY